jgi:hypothetical protein
VPYSVAGTDQTIWRLADLLQLVAGRVPLLIEIKASRILAWPKACIAIAKVLAGYNGPLAVMSFDLRVGEWFAKHAPDVVRGLVITDTLDHGYRGAWRLPHALERPRPISSPAMCATYPMRSPACGAKAGGRC